MRRPSTASQPSRQHRSQTLGALLDAPGAIRERQAALAGLAFARAAPTIVTEPLASSEPSLVVELRADEAAHAPLGHRPLRAALTLRQETSAPAAGGGLHLDRESSGWAAADAAELRSMWASSVNVRAPPRSPQLPLAAQASASADRFARPRAAPPTRAIADGLSGLELAASSPPAHSPVPHPRAHDVRDAPPVRRAGIQAAPSSPRRPLAARRKPKLPRFDEASSAAAMSDAERRLLAALGEAIPWFEA